MWEKIPMNDRPCVIMEERRNPPMGSRELSPCGEGKIPIGTTLSLWRRGTHL
jgi:hypothetical protein